MGLFIPNEITKRPLGHSCVIPVKNLKFAIIFEYIAYSQKMVNNDKGEAFTELVANFRLERLRSLFLN
jgi:hypothetical protein